jgi:hypothetical protein
LSCPRATRTSHPRSASATACSIQTWTRCALARPSRASFGRPSSATAAWSSAARGEQWQAPAARSPHSGVRCLRGTGRSGTVCLDVINQTWSPMFDLLNVFEVFLPQLLLYPNPTDPLNGEAAALMMREPEHYAARIRGATPFTHATHKPRTRHTHATTAPRRTPPPHATCRATADPTLPPPHGRPPVQSASQSTPRQLRRVPRTTTMTTTRWRRTMTIEAVYGRARGAGRRRRRSAASAAEDGGGRAHARMRCVALAVGRRPVRVGCGTRPRAM